MMERLFAMVVFCLCLGWIGCDVGVVGDRGSGLAQDPAPDGSGTASPRCDAGYHLEAATCVADVTPADSCDGQACSGHGSCVVNGGVAACECESDYQAEGLSCIANASAPADLCKGQTCSGHGTCAVSDGVAACQCEAGYQAAGLSCVVAPSTSPTCTYPAGPYGKSIGSVVSNLAKHQCYAPNQADASSLALESLFDCDGSKKIKAIYIVYVSKTCGFCQQEEARLGTLAQAWASKGIVLINVLLGGAIDSSVKTWRDKYKLGASYVCDPGTNSLFQGNAVPYAVLVDPRTMKIIKRDTVAQSAIDALVTQNSTP